MVTKVKLIYAHQKIYNLNIFLVLIKQIGTITISPCGGLKSNSHTSKIKTKIE